MRTAGIRGVQRRRGVTTTKRRRGADVAPDLVHRVFHAERPNALWVSDLTYVRTTEGMADVCFVVDAFSRMIVGWQVASEMTVQTVLRALEVARLRRGAFHGGLSFPLDRAHSDAGSQGGFNRSSQHLVMMEVFDGSWRQAVAGGADRCQAAVGGGSGVACADAFAGAA
jgi:putative transposase